MKLNHSYQQQIANVIQYAFNKSTSPLSDDNFISRYDHSDCYGGFFKENLASTIMVNHFEEQVFDSKVKMAGIGYVATLPEYRGMGHIQQLMDEIFQDLHRQGVVLSQLAPFSEMFYRQFGYENTSDRMVYRFDKSSVQLFSTEKRGYIRRGNWKECQSDIYEVYQKVIHSGKEVGSVVREDWWWNRLDSYYAPRHYAVAYDENNSAVGYMIYHMDKSTFIVDECCYLNVFALKKLLTFMKAHISSFDTFLYYTSMHDELIHLIPEVRFVNMRQETYMMTRIIDMQALLNVLPLRDDVVIGVKNDTTCPWNNGSWKKVNGEFELVEQEADLSADIQTWAAYFLGNLSFEDGLFLEKWHGDTTMSEPLLYKGQQHFYDYF